MIEGTCPAGALGEAEQALSIRRRALPVFRSAFAGYRFPAEVIMAAVRCYLR
jgi:hypothetical protein